MATSKQIAANGWEIQPKISQPQIFNSQIDAPLDSQIDPRSQRLRA